MESRKTTVFSKDLFFAKESIFSSFLEHAQYPWELVEVLHAQLVKKASFDLSFFSGVFFENQNEIRIEEGVKIAPGALIQGPCFLARGVKIGHGAFIRAGTFLAPGVVIGHCSEVCRSVVFENTKLPHFNYVGDSIIGQGVNLGAHATITNLRLDKKNVSVRWNGKKIDTGKRKFGALVGTGCQIGAGAIMNPGTIVLPHTNISPLANIKGCIGENDE